MTVLARADLEELLGRARAAAFASEEYIGQESFVTGTEVLRLAGQAGIGSGTSVLELCCGTGGPGLFITKRLGCSYVGVDSSPSAVAAARQRATTDAVRCRLEVGRVPPLPAGRFDAVLLVETLLAFSDRSALLRDVAAALRSGGRFALTAEVGDALTPEESAVMPASDTVWLTPLHELVADLGRAGLRLRWQQEWSASHLHTVEALVAAYTNAAAGVREATEREAIDRLLAAHRLWGRWLRSGRVRKVALVAERGA